MKQLLNAAFKPIIFAVNRIAFEDSCTIPNKDKIYLKYYFDNINDISTSLSNKTDRIRSENNELYLICKTKEKMEIVNTIEDLIAYQNRWDRLFKKKHRMIEQLKRKQKKQIRLELERKYEERMKEIYQLKMKTYLYDEEEKKRKKSIADKNRKEIERLKKEIEEKQ